MPRQGTQGMACRDGTGHTGHEVQGWDRAHRTRTGVLRGPGRACAGCGCPLMVAATTAAAGWHSQADTQPPPAPLLWPLLRASTSSGLNLGTHTYPDSLGKQGPRRDTWLPPWAEETCD